jgi:ribonuclease Z
VQIVFLGTGGYHPNERRQTSCVMLPQLGIVFDAGTAFFRVPKRLKTSELKIFLSHAHLDHVCGLTYPLVPLLNGTIDKIKVYGTEATLNAVRSHLFDNAIFPVFPSFEWCLLSPVVDLENARITTAPLHHPGGCVGFRLERNDHSLAYITDTSVNDDYLEFIRGVDLLIHECYFSDDMAPWCEKTGHSHTSQVAQLARTADVKRLILTHVDPQQSGDDPIGLATAQAIFPETILAEDLLEIDWP